MVPLILGNPQIVIKAMVPESLNSYGPMVVGLYRDNGKENGNYYLEFRV